MKIYVASSWRNLLQPGIVSMLRNCGHEVYDFRNPAPGKHGFAWATIDPAWETWIPQKYRDALNHPVAIDGFNLDMAALEACQACVLVLPSGRSASFEFGYAAGQKKECAVVMFESCEPELMYRKSNILTTLNELFDWAARQPGGKQPCIN